MNFQTVLGLLRPNVASLGYGLFLAINAASVWGGVFPFLPLAFQTADVMLWFFAAESVAFTATFLASAAGTWFFPAETRRFMVKAVTVPYMGGWCLLIAAMYLRGATVPLVCIGGALLGVGSAGFYMLWQRLFASQDAREGMGSRAVLRALPYPRSGDGLPHPLRLSAPVRTGRRAEESLHRS